MFEPAIHYVAATGSGPIRVHPDEAAAQIVQGRSIDMVTLGNSTTFKVTVRLDEDGNPAVTLPALPGPMGSDKCQVLGCLLIEAGRVADNLSHLIDG